MDYENIWEAAIAVSGLGGIGAFVLWSIFKGWLKLKIFANLTKKQTFHLMKLFLWFTFLFAVISLGTYAYLQTISEELSPSTIEAINVLKSENEQLKLSKQAKDKLNQTQAETIQYLVTHTQKSKIEPALEAVIKNGNKTKLIESIDELIKERDKEVRETGELFAKRGSINFAKNPKQALLDYEKSTQLTPDNAASWNWLGLLQIEFAKYPDAITSFEKALAIDLKIYGEDHPQVAIYRNNLGNGWKDLGQYQKAIEYYEMALASDLKNYGEDHPQVAAYRNNLGVVWQALGQYQKAIEHYKLALASNLNTYGVGHSKVATGRNNLGVVWRALGQYQKAIGYFELALTSVLRTYGKDHPLVAAYRNNIGMAWQASGQNQKAIKYYELALASDLKAYGEEHPNVAIDRNNLGGAWQTLGQYRKAVEYFELAFAAFDKSFGREHPSTKTVARNLDLARKALESTVISDETATKQ